MGNTFTNRLKLANPAIGDYNWSDEWYRNNFIPDVILNDQLSKNRIISGGVLTDGGGKTINYSAGSALFEGNIITWNAGNFAGTSGAIDLDFLSNYVYLNSVGVPEISINPPNGVFAMFGVADVDQASIDRIIDLRSMLTDTNIIPSILKTWTTSAVVDIFVYDTANDSDGGAWIDKATNQSWYWETLNTATRGRKRSFPKVALIVADTWNVTIFDLTEPDIPIWLVFTGATNNWVFAGNTFPKTSVFALNGVLCVGHAGNGGIVRVDFLLDNGRYFQSSQGICKGNILQRNSAAGYLSISLAILPGIINSTITDLSMIIIPTAAIDTVNNMIIPTIIATTQGGTSIIDGIAGINTIIDIIKATGHSYVFATPSRIFLLSIGQGGVEIGPIPSVDIANTAWRAPLLGSTTIPAVFNATYTSILDNAFGTSLGLVKYLEDIVTPANSMVAHITSTYNTGWMYGDCKRAIICECGGTTDSLVGGTLTDRSAKASTFTINGTLGRIPVFAGSDLQCIGQFSSSNYIDQAYDSTLDYGTGDFSVSLWVYVTVLTGYNLLVDRRSADTSGFSVFFNGASIVFRVGSSAQDLSVVTTSYFTINTFNKLDCVRESGVLKIYINGVLAGSIANTNSANATTPKLTLGETSFVKGYPLRGYLNLVRISNGLSANQIKKAYFDEKQLFKDNTKCTLKNESNYVTALSFDKKTNNLYCGQDTGKTIFNGLVAIESNYDSSFRAISANNKMISEATTTNAKISIPLLNLQEESKKKDEIIAKLSSSKVTTTSAGAGQTSIVLAVGLYPEQVFDAGLYKAFTITFNGFSYIANFTSSTGTIVVISKRV